IEMAAKKWNTSATGLKAENGVIVNTSTKEKAGYGELTKGQQLMMTLPDHVSLIAAKDWKIAGTSVPKIDEKKYISGKHLYVSDMNLPGMLYGKILRPPSYGAKLVEADVTKAKNITGVVVVKDGEFVGVAAPDMNTARKALLAIDA